MHADAEATLESMRALGVERVRLFDSEGHPISDSWVATDRVEATPLPPALKPGEKPFAIPGLSPQPPARRFERMTVSVTAEPEQDVSRLAQAIVVELLRQVETID